VTQPGYQAGSEPAWWWKVAQHLDAAQIALANAIAHNVDDPRPAQALYGRLREGQAILLDIFRMKGLIPAAPPAPGTPTPGMQMPPGPPPGVPWFGASGSEGGPPSPPPYFAEQGAPLAHNDPAVPSVDHVAAASEAEPSIGPTSNGAPPTVITPEPSTSAAPGGSSTEGVGG
jgi:hypothetical protein